MWWQAIYGKLWEPDQSRIREGAEYKWTGLSREIPKEFLANCTIDSLQLGVEVNPRWDSYPWPETGAYSQRPVEFNGEWHLVCARVNGLRESPDSQRYYTETQYRIAPLSEIAEEQLASVPFSSFHGQLTSIEHEMPQVDCPLREYEIHEGWLDAVSHYVSHLISGHTIATQDKRLTPDAFIRLANLVVSCFPKAVRWLIPIAAGARISSNYALGHCLSATGDVRLLGDEWKGHAATKSHEANRYMDWLSEIARGVRTMGELRKVVDEHAGTLSRWNTIVTCQKFRAVDSEYTWPLAMEAVLDISRFRKVTQWLADPSRRDAPSLRFDFHRDELFNVVSQSLNTPAEFNKTQTIGVLLAELADASWKPVFEKHAEACTRTYGFGVLLGHLAIDPPSLALIADCSVPVDKAQQLRSRLISAIKDDLGTDRIPRWESLFRRVTNSASQNFGGTILSGCEQDVVWLGLELYRITSDSRYLSGKSCPELLKMFRDILDEKHPEKRLVDEILKWPVNSKAKQDILRWFADLSFKPSVVGISILLGERLPTIELKSKSYFAPAKLRSSPEKWESIAAALIGTCEKYEWPISLLERLSLIFPQLNGPIKQKIAAQLKSKLDMSLYYLVVGEQKPSYASTSSLSQLRQEAIVDFLETYPTYQERLVAAVSNRMNGFANLISPLTLWLQKTKEDPIGVLLFVQTLLQNKSGYPLPSLSPADARLVWLCMQQNRKSLVVASEALDDIGKLRAIAACAIAYNELPRLTPQSYAMAITDAWSDMAHEFWKDASASEVLKRTWRMLGQDPITGKITRHEIETLLQLDDPTLIAWLLSGNSFPAFVLRRINFYGLFRAGLTPAQAEHLGSLILSVSATYKPAIYAAREVFLYCVEQSWRMGQGHSLADSVNIIGRINLQGPVRKDTWPYVTVVIAKALRTSFPDTVRRLQDYVAYEDLIEFHCANVRNRVPNDTTGFRNDPVSEVDEFHGKGRWKMSDDV